MTAALVVGTNLTCAIGPVGENCDRLWFYGYEFRADAGITDIGRRNGCGSDQARLGLDGDVRFISVSIGVHALVHVTSFRIHDRNNPVGRYFLSDFPGSVISLLDVLAGHQGQ